MARHSSSPRSRSLAQLLEQAGIDPLLAQQNKRAYEAFGVFLESSGCPRVLPVVRTLEEFRIIRSWLPYDDQTFAEFNNLLSYGLISMDDPLGALLEVLNFDSGISIKDIYGSEFENPDERFEWSGKIGNGDQHALASTDQLQYGTAADWHQYLINEVGINPATPGYFLNNPHKKMQEFVDQWCNNKRARVWNPSYAPAALPEKITQFCQEHKPDEILTELGLKMRLAVIYPVDGWRLARCLEISYAHKKK